MCPYFERELKKGGEPSGIRCKAATVNFPSKEAKRQRKKLSAEERWKSMRLKKLSVVLARMHKTYGEVQSMYYNGTLPDDFGK